jgi:hypothetical protein
LIALSCDAALVSPLRHSGRNRDKTDLARAGAIGPMLIFASWEKSTGCSASNGNSARAVYIKKEQSSDSAATDVEKDFNGRAEVVSGCGEVVPAFQGCT